MDCILADAAAANAVVSVLVARMGASFGGMFCPADDDQVAHAKEPHRNAGGRAA